MNLSDKIDKLNFLVKNHLPGIKAHKELYPLKNKSYIPKDNYHQAAVTVILTDNKFNQTELIFIKRPLYDGVHSGQIAFPGGKKEKNDSTLIETAKRECYEEINLSLKDENLIGKLSEVYIPISNFLVCPYLFYYPKITDKIIANIKEVESVFALPLKDIINPKNRVKTTIITNKKESIEVQCFKIKEYIIWGATGLIVNELKTIVNKLN